MVVTRGWGEGRMASCYLLGTELQFARWKEFCRWVKVMVVLPKGMCGLSAAYLLLKASKQARLVERKVCFTSDAGNWGRGRVVDVCPKADSPTDKQGMRAFTDRSVCRGWGWVGGGGAGGGD